MMSDGQPKPVRLRKKGDRYIADVFPKGMASLLFGDTRFELWLQEGKEPTQGRVYRRKDSDFEPDGHVFLVLGAGNHINVVVLDILHKLLCDDEVVVVKMNPQNAFLGVYVQRALSPFFERGFVSIVYGGVSQGVYLCQHDLIDSIHLTGSIQTYNQIVYGNQNPSIGSVPLTNKRVTAELGCVTPAILVPGDWSTSEMEYVASLIVAGLTSNSAHSCCALECLIVLENWSKRQQFLDVLKSKLNEKERQVAWYHGSAKKSK